MMFMDITIRMVLVYVMPTEAKQHAIKDITAMLKEDRLDNRVAETYPLDESVQAHQAIEKGGNLSSVIIKVD